MDTRPSTRCQQGSSKAPPLSLSNLNYMYALYQFKSTLTNSLSEALHVGERSIVLRCPVPEL